MSGFRAFAAVLADVHVWLLVVVYCGCTSPPSMHRTLLLSIGMRSQHRHSDDHVLPADAHRRVRLQRHRRTGHDGRALRRRLVPRRLPGLALRASSFHTTVPEHDHSPSWCCAGPHA